MWIWCFCIKFLSIESCWDFILRDCCNLVMLLSKGLFWRLFGIDMGINVFRLVVVIFNFVVICFFFLLSIDVCVESFVIWVSKVFNLLVVCCLSVLMFCWVVFIFDWVRCICVMFLDIDFVEWLEISIKIEDSIVVLIRVCILILCWYCLFLFVRVIVSFIL